MQDQILRFGIYADTIPGEIALYIHKYGSEYNALRTALIRIEQLKHDNDHILKLCEKILLSLETEHLKRCRGILMHHKQTRRRRL